MTGLQMSSTGVQIYPGGTDFNFIEDWRDTLTSEERWLCIRAI